MSVLNHERLHRWYDRFPPRGAWRACGGLIAFGLLAQQQPGRRDRRARRVRGGRGRVRRRRPRS